MSNPIPRKTRDLIWRRSKGRCEAKLPHCQGVVVDAHHLKSRAQGGSNSEWNLLAICRPCHTRITLCKEGTRKFRIPNWTLEFKEKTWPF